MHEVDWVCLALAGLFEMSGVVMIHSFHKNRTVLSFLWMAAGFGASFLFLALAMKTIPMGTAYAVWTGIGASGGAILGMIFFGESRSWKRLLFIGLIIASAAGLKSLS